MILTISKVVLFFFVSWCLCGIHSCLIKQKVANKKSLATMTQGTKNIILFYLSIILVLWLVKKSRRDLMLIKKMNGKNHNPNGVE